MPLKQCTKDGKKGFKWGDNGVCYIGPGARAKALKQGRAIEMSKATHNREAIEKGQSLEVLTIHTSGSVRREKFQGRNYIVTNGTLIVPGVLEGNQGPLYYPPEEVAQDPAKWNHMPLVVYHPESDDGKPLSGRDPKVLNTSGIGLIFNTDYNGKLVTEFWFDEAQTKKVDPRIYNALKKKKKIEMSTGLFTTNEPVPEGSVYNSKNGPKPYIAIARNYRPDHVAILPDMKGACSIADGCGVMNAKGSDDEQVDNDQSHDDVRIALSRQLRGRFTQDEPSCYIREVFDDYFIYWQGEDLYKLGYTKTDDEVTISDDTPEKVRIETRYVSNTEDEENPMALKQAERQKIVDDLATNCGCKTTNDNGVRMPWQEMEKEDLAKLTDGELIAYNKVREAMAANAENEEEEEEVPRKRRVRIRNKKVVNHDPEDDDEDEDDEVELRNNQQGGKKKKTQPTTNGGVADPFAAKIEWLKKNNAPPAMIQEEIERQQEIVRQKGELIDQITSNVQDEAQRTALAQLYVNHSLNELQLIANSLPRQQQEEYAQNNYSFPGVPNFAGNSGALEIPVREEPLPTPTYNWDKARRGTKQPA